MILNMQAHTLVFLQKNMRAKHESAFRDFA